MRSITSIVGILVCVVLLAACQTTTGRTSVARFLKRMPSMSLDEIRTEGPKVFPAGSILADHATVLSAYEFTDFTDPEPEINRLRDYDLMRRAGTTQTDIANLTLVRETGEIVEFRAIGLMEACKTEGSDEQPDEPYKK